MRKDIKYQIDPSGCWVCMSHTMGSRYPMINIDGKLRRMTRYLYEQSFGAIQKGLVVRHKCDNPRCINIDHLELGTPLDNARDMVSRGRQIRGSRHRDAKFSEASVRKIRKAIEAGRSIRGLARDLGVSQVAIFNIKHRKTWAWLD